MPKCKICGRPVTTVPVYHPECLKDRSKSRETHGLVLIDAVIEQLEHVKRKLEFVAENYTDYVAFDVEVLEGCISNLQAYKEEQK